MKVFHKALVVTALCFSMVLGVTGCGSKPLDGTQTVATVGEKIVTLGEANFFLRYQQVQTESYYESMLGEGIYEMDLYGDGSTYGESLKSDVLDQMQEYYILEEKAADYGVEVTEEEKAAITEAATAFLEANDENAKEQMNADQATVERILTLMTIRSKMTTAIHAEADVTVTDDEAAQRGFSYVSVSKGSGEDALSEEEVQENKDKLTAMIESVNAGNTMDAAAIEQGLSAYSGSYGLGTESYYDEAVITALDAMTEGQVSDVIETDTELYVVQLTAELDEAATESRRESLMTTKQTEYMTSLLDTWKEEYPLTVEEAVWEQVVFDRSYETKAE